MTPIIGQIISTLPTIGSVAGAIILFQLATLIIGGFIMQDYLSFFYEAFPKWWQRMLIVIIPLSGLGNIFAVHAYASPIVAGISFVVFGNWAAVISATIIGRISFALPDMLLLVAISVLAIWLAVRIS